MLPSGPLTPTLPFLPGFQQKCLAATPSTYGKTAIWLTLTGLKVHNDGTSGCCDGAPCEVSAELQALLFVFFILFSRLHV